MPIPPPPPPPRRLVSAYESGHSLLASLPRDSEGMAQRFYARGSPLVGWMTKENMLTLHSHRPMLVAYYDVSWEQDDIKSKSSRIVVMCSFSGIVSD